MPKPSTIVMKTGPDRRAPHRTELAKCQCNGVERGGTGVGAMGTAEINEEPGSPEIGVGDPLAVSDRRGRTDRRSRCRPGSGGAALSTTNCTARFRFPFDAPILALTETAAQVAQAAKAYRVYYAQRAEPGSTTPR